MLLRTRRPPIASTRWASGNYCGALAAFLAAARSSYEQMITLQIDRRGDEEKALEYAERSRRLGESSAAAHPSTVLPAFIPRAILALGKKSAAISTFALPEHLLVWLVTADGVDLRMHPVALERLRGAVDTTVEEIAGRRADEVTRGRLALLYNLLVAPFAERLAEYERLLFVLDSTLGALPVAALIERRSGR